MKVCQFVLKILSGNEIKGHNSVTNVQKIMCNNPNADCQLECINKMFDLVNINAYTKFGKILSICSQDIERKLNYDGQNDGQPKSSITPLFR